MSFLLLGLGLLGDNLIKRISKEKLSNEADPIHVIFIGFLVLHTLLGYLSLFAPIGLIIHVIVLAASIASLFLNKNYFIKILPVVEHRIKPLPLYIVIPPVMFLFLILSYSLYSFNHYDTGLYYLQNIQWIEHYPVVKGLANLHGRFGFNSHFFLDSAFFKLGFFS